jgi:iron complex outermembrane recepter protein
VNWKAGLEYDFSDHTSSYATATTGFKSGGINIGFSYPLPNFAPEKVTNYEIGVKTRLFNNTLKLNTAFFDEEYKNLQVTQLDSVHYSTLTENAAAARIYGAEIEAEWQPSGSDQFSGFVNYLHATYLTYLNTKDQLTQAVIPSLNGNYLPNSPVTSFRVQYQHHFALPNGGIFTPMLAVYWQAKNYLREFNSPIDEVDSYSRSTLNLTYVDPSGHWRLQGYVNNLENSVIRQEGYTVLSHYFSNYDAPRTFGARLSYKY